MKLVPVSENQWQMIQEIYLEAFPKAERKPFFMIKREVKRRKAQLLVAMDEDSLQGFTIVIPYKDKLMIDYLAISHYSRGKGIGSYIIQEICKQFPNKRIVLLIEQPDDKAKNQIQRLERRKFYLKNGFLSSDITINSTSGKMEVLNKGDKLLPKEYIELQKYTLGLICFKLAHIQIIS